MQGGKRKLSSWNIFVKKIYREGKGKNSSYSFQNALKDASARKSEMGSSSSSKTQKATRSSRRSKSASAQAAGKRRRKTRKH